MTNTHRWLIALGLSFLAGACEAASDPKASITDYIRHGLLEVGPVAVALKMTLQPAAAVAS